MARDRWPSRTIFVYAAIGSAVGLGNVWRYPYLAQQFGGGAFLIPFLIALFVAGIPLLILEFALGQRFQKGAVDSFAAIKTKFSGIGWWALFTAFLVITYYVVVMAWSLIYLLVSPGVQWSEDPEGYFYGNVIQLSSGVDSLGSVVPAVFIALLFCWLLIFFSVWKGIRSVSKVVMWTVPLPVLLLVILLIRAVTLDGSIDGIIAYIKPDFATLFSSEVWRAAFSQVFFSLSLAFGVMIAYSSYNKKKSDIAVNAYTIGISDAVIAILAGFVVFATLGFMADQQSSTVADVVTSGPGLAFVTFPQALSLMPFATFFSILFFITLLTLAIDSAFSLVEAISTTILDKSRMKKQTVALLVCSLGFLGGIVFTTQGGLFLLDIVDHFLTNISLIIIGIAECVIVGWVYGAGKLRKYVNQVSETKIGPFWEIAIKYITPIGLAVLLGFQLKAEFIANYGGYPDWAIVVGWGVVLIPLVIAFLIPQKKVSAA